MNEITIRRPDDFHHHGRNDNRTGVVLPYITPHLGRVLMMPNLQPHAILTGEEALEYVQFLKGKMRQCMLNREFEIVPTIAIQDSTSPAVIKGARACGIRAAKIYPLGVTTNSHNGLRNFYAPKTRDVFRAMEDVGMICLVHCEIREEGVSIMRREEQSLHMFHWIHEQFPALKLVFEHASTADAITMVKSMGANVAATITAHHLKLTIDDVLDGGTQPHHMCMPVPKEYKDRKALIEAATSGDPKFFFGSDSAPHTVDEKECAKGACGVFSAPVMLQTLVEVFEDHNALDRLEGFTSTFGAEFYGLPFNQDSITFVRKDWEIGRSFSFRRRSSTPVVVPYRAGEVIRWQIKR